MSDAASSTVVSTFSVAIGDLETSDNQAAIRLLEMASFLAPDHIPIRIFTAESLGLESEAQILRAVDALAELSLIMTHNSSHFSMHRLVQAVSRDRLRPPSSSGDLLTNDEPHDEAKEI